MDSTVSSQLSEDREVYGYRERPWALLALAFFVAGVCLILVGRPSLGIALTLVTPLPLVARTWMLDSRAQELTIRYDLFGLDIRRRTWPFARIDRIVVEPAGEGFVRAGNRYGMVLSLVIDGKRVAVAASNDQREIAREVRALRRVLPRGIRYERRMAYVAWKP